MGKITRIRKLKFCTVIVFTTKPKEKFGKPKISVQGRSQGPLSPDEIWSKTLPDIV